MASFGAAGGRPCCPTELLMSSKIRWISVALLASGCGLGEAQPSGASSADGPRVKVHVAAASDLAAILPSLIEMYRKDRPGVEFVLTFGSSGQLAEQIKAGAPFALFLSANEAYLKGLVKAGEVLPHSARPYAVGSLVVITEKGMEAPLATLNDLARPEYRRIAVANPETAPYGTAARQALRKAELWDRLSGNLVFAESVRQALQFVETGSADAAIVGKAVADPGTFRLLEVGPGDHDPIVQWLGVTAKVPEAEAEEAERLASFILGEQGRAALVDAGFGPPSSTDAGSAGDAP